MPNPNIIHRNKTQNIAVIVNFFIELTKQIRLVIFVALIN